MTNIPEQFRQDFLKQCRNTGITTEELMSAIDFAKSQPTIFSDHSDAPYLHTLQIKWTPGYFEECMKGVEDVFSIPRITHLLKVRDFLRHRGDAGFKPRHSEKIGLSTAMHTEFFPKENLRENFQTENFDLLRAQIALRLEIYDMSNESSYLNQAIQWAEQKANNIFSPYEVDIFKKPISENKSDWKPDYFDIQTEYLSKNFSKERYLHLIEVRQYLRDHRVEGFVPPQKRAYAARDTDQADTNTTSARPHSESPSPDSMPRALRTALMVGGAIAALLVLVLSITR